MDHQDWTPVIVRKTIKKKKNIVTNKKNVISDEQRRKIKVENESETFKIEKVSRSFGKEMQQARCAKKFTQKTLAQRLNVKPTIIANYEQGKAIPNNAFISKIERVLGVKLPRKGKKKNVKNDSSKK
jgi:putative transcription factor